MRSSLLTVGAALLSLVSVSAGHRAGLRARKPHALQEQKEARERALAAEKSFFEKRSVNETSGGNLTYKYLNNRTSEFLIQSLPDVPFDLGEIYSGLIPIDNSNTSEALFFVFQPTVGAPVDEIVFWTNGGPGCSSLEAFLQENGMWTWQPGTYEPVLNPYSWANLTNMLWVEQPIGTGFSIGTPKATTEEEIADDFIKWFKNFQQTFGIKNHKIYVTGESYAGRYVPYISAAMLDQNDTEYYNLSGALIYDGVIGEYDYVQGEIPAVPFVEANANLFNFNETFMSELKGLHESCGYADYIDRYMKFPPVENQPHLFFNYSDPKNQTCDLQDIVNNEVLRVNPCFDIYSVNLMCPLQWDVLGFPTGLLDAQDGIYFNRSDVKAAMHAPDYIDWTECSNEPVFVGGNGGPQMAGDFSLDPIQKVLPRVIEATNRVLISNGDFDMIILTNGSLLSIQNMTWNGQLGFQNQPNASFIVDLPDLQDQAVFAENGLDITGQGVMGIKHYERGLAWVETFQSGHMQPQYQPRSSYRHLQWLLHRIEDL
ncbi:hypothetical protein IAR55_002699 [Kwoniella newhampshirensis]|uniref:Carboxypeptidase n=1 Tax=Kwoniella newhampshirensis TaxID=1651941 RepID=A0AAW0YNF4_9TREE